MSVILLEGYHCKFRMNHNYALSTDARWVQGNVSWYTPALFLKHLPFLKRKAFDEALHLRSILVADRRPYWEVGYSIGFLSMARVGIFVGFDKIQYRSVGVSLSIPFSLFKQGGFSL